MRVFRTTVLIGIALVALGLLTVSPAAAETTADIDEDVVSCEVNEDVPVAGSDITVDVDVAVIPYEDASSIDLWINAE